jgi:predicted ATPase
VLVVGHQTSGKSALIEALMGFQFNQVGGGTKTRRPIALRMQYNPECDQPRCHLTLENGREEPRLVLVYCACIHMMFVFVD